MTRKGDGKYTKKEVDPSARILNDSDTGTDHLGHGVYAEMLANTIATVKAPVTIGIFARWGSGKSFLLNHVCGILWRMQQQEDVTLRSMSGKRSHKKSFALSIVLLIVILGGFAAPFCALFVPEIKQQQPLSGVCSNCTRNTTDMAKTYNFTVHQTLALVTLCFSVGLLCVVVFMLCCCRQANTRFWSNFKLLLIAAFTKLPVGCDEKPIVHGDDEKAQLEYAPSENGITKSPNTTESLECCSKHNAPDANQDTLAKRYIVVKFNAWAYARSENLWAGIATSISEAVELEFGSVTSRLFRLLDITTVTKEPEECEAVMSTRFFAMFSKDHDSTLHEILQDFGVICVFEKYKDWVDAGNQNLKNNKTSSAASSKKNDSEEWFVVEYLNKLQSKEAYAYLEKQNVIVQYDEPRISVKKPKNLDLKSSNLARNNANQQNNIEMGNLKRRQDKQADNRADQVSTQNPNPISRKSNNSNAHSKPRTPGFWYLFRKYAKTACHLPVATLVAVAILLCILVFVASVATAATQAIKIAPLVLGPIAAALPIVTAIVSFAWAMFHSQTSRITSALTGMKSNMADELGAMEKIKYEIQVITKLVQCTQFSHFKDYKIVLAIDDLDRVPLNKVKSVLEAVNILLSDTSSPFVCMIAVDPRVAVSSVEVEMADTLLKTNVNGHEYLKKIINLPFCLPDVGMKPQYISGLIDQADKTKTVVSSIRKARQDETDGKGPKMAASDAAATPTPTGSKVWQGSTTTSLDSINSDRATHPTAQTRQSGGAALLHSVYRPNGTNQNSNQVDPRQSFSSTSSYGGGILPGASRRSSVQPPNAKNCMLDRARYASLNRSDTSSSEEVGKPPGFFNADSTGGGHDVVDSAPLTSSDEDVSALLPPNSASPQDPGTGDASNSGPSAPTPRTVNITTLISNPIRTRYAAREHGGKIQEERSSRQMEDIGERKFLFECKRFFNEDQIILSHLHSNPRNIKRIFNVLTLTAAMINCHHRMEKRKMYFRNEKIRKNAREVGKSFHQITAGERTEDLAKKIARWVVLTDQWPYRTSYILQVIEDADQRGDAGRETVEIQSSDSLLDIYEKNVLPELRKNGLDDHFLALDDDGDTFYSYLKRLGSEYMSKETATSLLKYTINLDHSIRLSIAKKRERLDIEGNSDNDDIEESETEKQITIDAEKPVSKYAKAMKRKYGNANEDDVKKAVVSPQHDGLVISDEHSSPNKHEFSFDIEANLEEA